MALNEVTQLLLALMREDPQATGKQLLEQTATRINHPNPEAVVKNGRQLLENLLSKHVILGTRTGSSQHA
jgi:hypothetical protein